ncbi:type II toxin-antitoxin system HicA family toxin [soil metagenome]
MPKVRDVIRMLEEDGWELDRVRGSHRIFKHPDRQYRVVVAGKPNHDLSPGTWNNIQRQAGWREGPPG